MSTGFAAKKRCIYLTVSLLENDVPQTLRAIVRTVFVPTPQFRCVVFFLRSYPSRLRIDLITYESIQSTADTTNLNKSGQWIICALYEINESGQWTAKSDEDFVSFYKTGDIVPYELAHFGSEVTVWVK